MANGVDKVRICSMALRNIGKPRIRSIDRPKNDAEAVCKENYDIARSTTLEGALWNFASGWRAGVRLDIEPKPGWQYVYSYPSEALKVFGIHCEPGQDAPGFEVTDRMDADGKIIHTNEAAPVFIFVKDKEDPSTFTWEFITALSWVLASMIVMPLTKDRRSLAKCEQNAMMYTSMATASTLNESKPADDDQNGFHHRVR